MNKKLVVLFVCMLLTVGVFPIERVSADENIIYVDDDAPPDWYDATHVRTIHEGINNASTGYTVMVMDGLYTGVDNRDLDFNGLAIVVRSENGPDNCVIDCEGDINEPHRGFYFHNNEDEYSVVQGFTIQNGYAPDSSYGKNGGAIYCISSSPTITNNVISENYARTQGGGICLYGSNPRITYCNFSDNGAYYSGAGIYCLGSEPTINHCTFSQNSAGSDGGGISFNWDSYPIATNCIFFDNSADEGGGIFLMDSHPTINKCLFIENQAIGGGGIQCRSGNPTITNCTFTNNMAYIRGGGIYFKYPAGAYDTITNCILWNDSPVEIYVDSGNPVVTYSDIEGGWPGTGNIDADPLFIDPDHHDYHLQINSPCIDTGNPDWVDPDGSRSDMGAFPTSLNFPPNKPDKPSGPSVIKKNVNYSFSTSTIDINNDQVYYMWDWGDGSYSDWLGPVDSGETYETYHQWSKMGYYNIRVKAKDVHDEESEWSDPLPIVVPQGCVEGTQINMAYGSSPSVKNIEDIEVGDYVSSYDLELQVVVPAEVIAVYSYTELPETPLGIDYNDEGNIGVTSNLFLFINGTEWMVANDTGVDYYVLENTPGTNDTSLKPITSIDELCILSVIYDLEIKPLESGNISGYFADGILVGERIPPEITNVSNAPDTIGFGFNVTINANVVDDMSGVNIVNVGVTYPDESTGNYTMNHTSGDTYQYVFTDTWLVGQYNYTIWAVDNAGNGNSSSQYSFTVSAQCNVSIQTLKDEYGSNEYINITDPPENGVGDNEEQQIGYELLDDNTVLHIWNRHNDYYFNTSSGIQLTNHYNEYWSHNVLMLGYYNNEEWNLIYRTDELSGFNKNIDSDNETYINATLWKDLTYGDYDFRLSIRYHLGVNDSDLTVIPYIRNLGQAIPYNLAFGWELKDIKIDNTYENDWIRINRTSYPLNQILDIKYTNITRTVYNETTNETYRVKNGEFRLENIDGITPAEYLYLRWNPNLDYLVWVKSRDSQYNAPVTLFIKIGTLGVDQEKFTELHWLDAEGDYIDSWPLDGDNEDPCGITTDGTNIWVVDYRFAVVYKYDMVGEYIDSWPLDQYQENGYPHGITTDGTNIWVVDHVTNDVYKYDMVGEYIDSWPLTGESFESYGIATDGTNIWVVDGFAIVYKYDMVGEYIDSWPLYHENTEPNGIATDGTNIWVVGYMVYKYDMVGEFIDSWPLDQENGYPHGITTDGTNIWVVDISTDAVYEYEGPLAPPTNCVATDGTYGDKVVVTWTKSAGASIYRVWIGFDWSEEIGDVDTFDAGGPPPTITPGGADASDGTHADYVTLIVSGESGNDGSPIPYKVQASTDGISWSVDSNTDTGYRGKSALSYQWHRSAADSDASYSTISGGTTDPYDDIGAPADGGGRYYKCLITMTGANSQYTTVDRGYRESPHAPTQINQKIWNSTTSIEKSLNATDVDLYPTSFNVTINDADGDLMNITIMTNESGSWTVVNQTSGSGLTNDTYSYTNTSWVDTYNTKYWISFNVTDGTNWTNNIYHFTTYYIQSKINNTGSTNIKGYLFMQVQYNNSGEWVVDTTVVNDSLQVINSSDQLALDQFFNGEVNTDDLSHGSGTYRVYAAFRDPDENILKCDDETELVATYEFDVTFS